MRYGVLFIMAILSVNVVISQEAQSNNIKELAALNKLPVKWQTYWNSHNMDSMGTLLAEDVDFVNVAGNWLKGKKNTVLDHKVKHAGVRFSKSTWETDSVSIKFLKKDLALIHLGWGLSGAYENETTMRPANHGIFTWIVAKKNNKWLIQAAQNTTIK